MWLRLRHGPPPDAPPPEHWALTLTGSVPVIGCLAAVLVAFALSVCLLRHLLSVEESDEREEEGEATHHDATMQKQRDAALYEAAAMATAPVEPSPGLSPGGGGKQLQADGVVCLSGAVSDAACEALLRAVNARPAALLARPGGRRVASYEAAVEAEAEAEAAAAAEVAVEAEGGAALVGARRAAGEDAGEEEALLGAVLCREQRYDLKLSLQEPAVLAALTEALAAAGPACAHVLGPQPELFELGALVADSGAPRQPVHPDTPWHEAAAVVSCFVALQHVEAEMGATLFLPRTHADAEAQEAYLRGQPSPWGAPRPATPPPDGRGAWDELLQRAPCRAPLLRRGSCALFDSRILHCGSANSSGRRRVVFYFSLKARGHGNGWKGGGFIYPGTLLDELRGRYSLSSDTTSLVPCVKAAAAPPPASHLSQEPGPRAAEPVRSTPEVSAMADSAPDKKKRKLQNTDTDPMMTRRLTRELRELMRTDTRAEMGIEFELVDDDVLTEWRAKCFYDMAGKEGATTTQNALAAQLKDRGLDYIEFRIRIPPGYPGEPPSVRGYFPRIKGPHVSQNGAFCAEALSKQFGWSPACRTSMLMLAVRSLLENSEQGGLHLQTLEAGDCGGSEKKLMTPYDEAGARSDFDAITRAHPRGYGAAAAAAGVVAAAAAVPPPRSLASTRSKESLTNLVRSSKAL